MTGNSTGKSTGKAQVIGTGSGMRRREFIYLHTDT